jgi:uncharacterized damage-inducible protein DinB
MDSMPNNLVAENFLAYASKRLLLSQEQIGSCLDMLTEEQMWHRAGDYENSIANLLLHLEGNIRQWILHGIDNQPDTRERDAEFALEASGTAAEARTGFNATLDEAARIVAALDPERLLTVIDPQPNGTWRHPTILDAIFKVVGHLEMHTGQIIVLTKQRIAGDLDLSMPRKR